MELPAEIDYRYLEARSDAEVSGLFQDHAKLVYLVNQLRLNLNSRPAQSFFRVTAILIVSHIVEGQRIRSFIFGSNSEPGNLGGAICAERAALVRLRLLNSPILEKLVVTTDSQHAISPGPLCREFLQGCGDPSTPLVITNGPGTDIVECTIADIFPYPYMYRKLSRDVVITSATRFSSYCQPCTTSLVRLLDTNSIFKVMQAAHAVNSFDNEDPLHPIRLSAAVLYEDGETQSTYQLKGLEYGCTSDPMEAIIHFMLQNKEKKALLLVMLDQFGVCHAPFARARAQLAERGFDHVSILIHTPADRSEAILNAEGDADGSRVELQVVKVKDLLPSPGSTKLLTHDEFIN